jgi:hypothetical protein
LLLAMTKEKEAARRRPLLQKSPIRGSLSSPAGSKSQI